MKPFFTFFGGKWRAAPRYPLPIHNVIVEPFAGAAGYSVRNHQKKIILIENGSIIRKLLSRFKSLPARLTDYSNAIIR